MKIISKHYIYLLLLAAILSSCAKSYQRVLKSNDPDYKYTRAKEYYEKGDCVKALPLFEELITVYKGTKSIDDIYYMYATCHFEQDNFLVASFHFKNIHDSYPLSDFAEESLYMFAYCYYSMSPNINLDQTYTEKAISAFQLYINSYPNSTKIKECTNLMSMSRRKLELKSFKNAELYLKTGKYKAAATAFKNLLIQYPDTKDAEKALFLIVKSNYEYAENSIVSKQIERYLQTIESYKDFTSKYKDSAFSKEATELFHSSTAKIDKLNNQN